MEGADWNAILFDIDAMLECVGGADFPRGVGAWGLAVGALL